MLRSNLWTSKGLVNDAIGIVTDIVYGPNESPRTSMPAAIMMRWDNYTGPCLTNELFPLTPVTRHWTDKGVNCTRTQFPICLAWAITIHKSQGMTLTKAVIDIGEKEYAPGLTYVAFSRVKTWDGIAVDPPFTYRRLQAIRNSAKLTMRIAEENRLAKLK